VDKKQRPVLEIRSTLKASLFVSFFHLLPPLHVFSYTPHPNSCARWQTDEANVFFHSPPSLKKDMFPVTPVENPSSCPEPPKIPDSLARKTFSKKKKKG
jgi:hypothetical protein